MCPSSDAPASWSSRTRSAVPARYVAFPEMNVCLDAELFPASGVVSVSAPSVDDARHVDADRVGADLRHHGVGALSHVDRSLDTARCVRRDGARP